MSNGYYVGRLRGTQRPGDSGRARANAYPDPAAGAIEREPTFAGLELVWEALGWDVERMCWRDGGDADSARPAPDTPPSTRDHLVFQRPPRG